MREPLHSILHPGTDGGDFSKIDKTNRATGTGDAAQRVF
jgi:hypothetical protein